MTDNFNSIFQHDAVIKSLTIDRSHPGQNDIIHLNVFLRQSNKNVIVEFFECHACKTSLNFGIQAEESISSAKCISNSTEITAILETWSKIGVHIQGLKCYEIQTNSTNSEIKIFALGCRILES